MYTIQVVLDGNCARLSLKVQGSKKTKKIAFEIGFLAGKVIHLNEKCEIVLESTNSLWNQENAKSVGRSLFNFFLNTRFAASTEWTSFWHVKKVSRNLIIYRMYDCSLQFLSRNVELYLK
jgi:hypothetical protein